MELDSLWLTRLQQLIFKVGVNDKIDIKILIDDSFKNDFIYNAKDKGYLKSVDNKTYEMTDKLRYMPITVGNFKPDPKHRATKFKNNNPILIETTFNSAKEYHLASTILATQSLASIFEGERIPLINSCQMLGAFACELYLKTLILLNGKSQNGHGLKSLFDNLNKKEKDEITDYFLSKRYTKERFLLNLTKHVKKTSIKRKRIPFSIRFHSFYSAFFSTYSTAETRSSTFSTRFSRLIFSSNLRLSIE